MLMNSDVPQQQDVPSGPEVLDVLIGPDDSVMIAGFPVAVPDGEPVHDVVLDVVHRYAQAQGKPVEVAIHDKRESHTIRIRVAPDGSSRVVRDGGHHAQPEPEPQPAPGPQPPAPVAPGPPAMTPSDDLEASPGQADPPPADANSPVPVPDQLVTLVTDITQALQTGALERAGALSFRLRAHTARTFGAEHPFTLEARSLDAFVAHRCGDHGVAMTKCLELALIRHRLGQPHAREDLERASAAWWRMDDPASAVEHGHVLAAAWSQFAGQDDHSDARDTELIRQVQRRLRTLATEMAPREAGPVTAGAMAGA